MGDNNNKVAVMSDGVKTLDGMTGNTRYVIYDGKGKKMSAPKDMVDSKGFAAYATKLPGGTVELVKGNDVFNVPLDEAEAAIADGMRPFTFFKAGKNQPKKKDWNAYKTRTVDAGISKIQEEGQPAGYDPNNKWFVPDWNKPQDMTMWAEPTWMQQAEDDGYTRNAADDRKMAALGNAINTTSQAVADTYNVTMDDGSKMPDLSGKPSLDIKRYDLGSAAPDIIDDTAKKIAADRSYDAVMGRTNYDIHRRIKSGYEKSMRADEAKKKKENQIFSVLGGMRNPMTGAINGGTDRNKSAETKMYEAASLFMDRAEKMQSAAADNAGFWRGAKDKATDINTWTGGVADLNQMAALATALNKADKGGKLNTAEQTLLDAAAYYTQAAMDADDKLSTWYNVGSGVVESAPFMLEFMVNPIGGGSKALAKQMIKYTAKQFGKHLTNKAVRKAVQIGARQAAAVASGAAMAGTTGMPAVMADTYRRMNGKAMGAIGGDGALTFDQAVERDGFGEALKKSFAARTIENWTETAGWFDEILPVMGKYLKGSKLATKIMDSGLGKGMSKMFDKAANSKSGRLLKEGAEYIDNSVLGHAVKNVQDRVHFSGNIGETLEEFQGSIANSIVVGDQKLDTSKEGVFNRDNMIQTFLTCSVISGAMQAPSVVAGAYKGLSDYDYVKASNNARRVIGSQWDGVRQALQDASNKDRVQYLHNVLRSAAYSAEDKKAIMMYVGALAKHEASRFFRNATRLNNEQYAYRNRKKIIEEFEQSKQGLTDEDLQALDQYDNFEELDRQTDISRDPERAVQIERYMEAREDMYYYIDAMNRHISDRVNSRYQEMQGDINQDMGGRVVAQSNYSGGDVVVTGGRLAINEDGSVDKANSDKVIYYRDRDGRVHMSTPDMFSAASVTSEADIKAQLEAEEREAEDMLEDEELNGGTAGGSGAPVTPGASEAGVVAPGDGSANGGVSVASEGAVSPEGAGATSGAAGTPVEASADQQSAQPVSGGASVGSGYTAQVGDAVTAGGRDGVVVSVYDDEVIVNHGGSEYRSYSLDAVAPTQSTEQGATAGNSSNGQVATEMNSATQPTQPSQPVEAAQAMPTDAAGAVGVANGGDVAGGSAGDVTPGDAGSIAPGVDAAPEASVQMPMTDKGEEDFMRVAPNVTLDYLKGQGMSEEDIAEYVALQIRAAEAEVAKAGKAKTSTNLKKFKEAKSKAAEAKAKLDYWNQVGGLMQTGAEQVAEADTDTGIADGATTGSTGNTAADGAVPDVVMDNAADARARGYRMVMGEKVSRQEFVPGVVGNDVSVRFGNGANDAVQGNYVVVDAGSIQPSHKGGVRNHSFFLDEAQPKDRRDDASVMAAEAMANNMRPQEITEGVTAYTGAPVVNSRGEVIQGNNRSAALIQMHEQNGAEADKYKQYLVDHAEQFGVDADTVAGMEYPVLVRMVDVEDAEAIRLGNMTAQDTESGGVERIKPQQSYTRLGDKVRSFMRLLLDSVEEDQSYSEVIAQNAVTALKFLADHGAISNTQYQSAFDANGNVTAEAKLDLKEMAEFNLFEGGAQELPRMFRALPARVQKAILQTFMRDADSAEADRIKGDIQNAIVLFDRAMAYSPEFRSAKDYESAKRALFVYGLQGSLIEGDKPAKDLFDNFAFELAARFRSMTQKGMVQMFQAFYDKVQGAGMDLFHPDAKPMSKADAVRDVFNVELNKANDHEQKNENDVGNDIGDGETGRSGSSTDDRSGGETSQGNGNAESDGGTADGRTEVEESLDNDKHTENTGKPASEGVSEYRYGMTVRPFGIGNQPDGALRHEDGGGAYGTVVYDHPLTEEEVKNFNLTPLTEAESLVGKRFSYEIGGHTLYCEVLSAENGRVRFSVNGNSEMVWDYYEFMHKMKPVEESVSDSGVASEDASENENGGSENESLNDSDSEVGADNTANDGRASVREEVRESQRTPLKMRKMVEAVCGKLGLKVQWHDTLRANGYYDPDKRTVHIARDADNPLRMVFGHEVTHAVKLMNPKAYDKLRDAVKKLMGEAEFTAERLYKKQLYESRGFTGHPIEYYEEELVCDMIGEMFDNNTVAEAICDIINDRSILGEIKRVVRRMIDVIRNTLGMNNDRVRALIQLQHTIEDAIRNTDGNAESAEENGERLSLREGSSREKVLRDALVDILRASGLDVVTDSEQAQRVLDEVNVKQVSVRMRMGDAAETFQDRQKLAVKTRGVAMPGLNEASVKVVNDIPRHSYKGDIKQATREAIDAAKKKYADKIETYNAHGIRFNYTISGNAIEICLSPRHQGKSINKGVHLALAEHLDEVINNSIEVEEHPDYVKVDSERGSDRSINENALMHRFYGVAVVDGIPYRVMTLMREEKSSATSNGIHSYEVQKIEVLDNELPSTSNGVGSQNQIGLSYPLAKLLKDVEMSYRPGVKVLEESKKRSLQLREHRVYHGSGAAFDAFDHSHMGEGEGLQAYGWGTYVTEVEGIGRTYAEASGSTPSVQFVYDGDVNGVSQSRLNDIIEMAFDAIPSSQDAAVSEYNSWLQYLGSRIQRDSNEWLDSLYQDALKLDPKKFVRREVLNRHLYTVEIPDDNGSNYLHWEKPLTREQIGRITEKLKSGGWNIVDGNHPTFEKNGERIVLNERAQGQDVYAELEEALGSDKVASEFLASIGFTGISYPAEARSGGRKDGARNFVIFNEADAKIVDHVRFFKTANGEAYGFTVGGKIYLDPRLATAETPIHEYAHLWADALRAENPKEWQNVVELMKGTSVWEDVKGVYPELKTDEAVADEVLAHYSGSRGAEKLRRALDEIVAGNMDAVDKMTALSALNRVKDALEKFWKAVADFFGIEFTSAEDVADRVMGDLLNGVNPNKVPNSSSVDADEFAAKHHLNLNDVKKYADAMKSGNLGGASYAFKNIKRSVLLANEGLSMSQFLKVFNPIKKDLFGSFGSVEELRNEHIETELERRNVMEAARKREEAEKEAERERLKEFELMSDETLDETYMEAVRNNDEQRMRDFVNEAARRKGYQSTDEFRMSHRAPSYDEDGTDKSLIDVANNKDNIRDSLEDHFRMNRDKNREESIAAIRQAIQEIEKGNIPNVTIYRAVPKSLKEGSVRNGDWITLSESYAKQHGNHALNGEYRIMKEVVPADNLYWDGNDINEWGYDDKSDYVYRNTKNNRKLNELVVRDDKGEIIPLSKRFNSRKKDVRFSLIGTKGAAALDKAEEASVRLDNLAVAREMEATGKDAKTVKMATGWERGADGKWRYEVQDFDVDVHGMARRNHLHDKLPWGKEYEAMVDKLFSDEMLTAEEEVRFDELSSLAQNLQETYEKTETRYLDDYVMDRSLFKAYPELRQVRVEMYNDPWSLVGATWYGSADLVRINEAKFDTQDLRSILIHEVQHAIQDIEGFARGGNESTYRNLLAGLREKHDSWAVIEEFEDKSKELGSDVQPIDVYYAVIDEYQSLGIEFGDGFAPSREAFDNGFNLWLRGYDNEGYEDAYNEYQRLVGKFGFGEGDSRYNQLAGEVEARNVQKRMDMTAEERRNSLASETEDVAREDQIFIMEHAGSSEMGSRVNRHMAEIGKRFDKEDLDSNQRAVVDVYSGKKNNETITVKRADGDRKIVMRQGTENKAGTKHSLYRHYGRSEGEITAGDVILIPEILRDGERISTKNGKGSVYSLEKDGIRYRVYTEVKDNKEEFCDFYTNKKGSNGNASTSNKEVSDAENTQLSAHEYNIATDAKIDSNSESSSSDAVNNAKGERFSLRDAGVSGERNLVAVHNISEEKLKQAFELGGFPMPSIAITKADMGHGEFGEISLVFGRDTVDPSDSQNKVYGEDAWTPVFPSIGYKLDEDKALSIYRKTNEASDLPLFESFRFHPENLVDRVGRNGVQDLVEYFRDSYEAKQLYLHDKGNAVTEYEKQKGEKYSAENIAFYDKILEEIGLDRLKNDKDNVQDAVKQAMVKYLGTDFENMRPRMVLPYVNSAIYNAVDYAENGNEKTGKDIKATQEKIDSRINQKDFEKWLTELFDGIIEKRGIRNEKDPYTSSGNRRKWEQLYDAVTLDNILKNMRKQPKRGGSGMFNGSPFGAAQREYRSMEEIRKDAEKRIRTVDAQEFESQRNAIAERFFSVVIPGVDGFSARADMTETLIEAVAHSHTARGIYNYLKKYYPEVTMDVAKELADIVKDIQQLSARYFESKPYRAVGFDEVRLAVVPSDTDAAVVDRLKSMGIEVRPYERGNESERSAIVRDVTKERDLRFSLRGSKNTVATDSYSSPARLTKRQVQKVFGGIWIADKQEFAKFAAAVNNFGIEHDGEGIVYTDNYLYAYYYNIDGVAIPYASVYLNADNSQELVKEIQDDIKRNQITINGIVESLWNESGENYRNYGNNTSQRNRRRNGTIRRKFQRKGRYLDNPSLYVKTGRGYEGLPNRGGRGGRGGLEDKGSRFSLRDGKPVMISPLEMSEDEKRQRGEQLLATEAVNVESGQIVKGEGFSARQAAEKWWKENITTPLYFQTEVGDVLIDNVSIGNSLAHRYGQAKLDAITSLKNGFKNAVYLGCMKDFARDGNVYNHYFAYPILYNGNRCYVFCRVLNDANVNRLYVHEVFVADRIEKGNTLQTAASQPHGGIALYKDIIANVLDTTNIDNDFTKSKSDAVNKAKGERFSLRDGSSRVNPNKVPNSSSVDADEFAAKHHLNLNDVKKYADAMKSGNLGGASYAFKNIKRSVLLANEGLSMSQFLKVFNPIKKDLFGSFGSVEELRNEHIETELERRNVMEAARKREEAEKEAERERLKEFELMSDETLDETYMEAVRNNDEQRMRDFVNEAARRKGYQSTDEFRMSHRAPSYDEDGTDKSLIDVANNKDNIRDSLEDHFRMNRDKNREESIAAIRQAIQEIEKGNIPNVTIYRAVPKSLKEGSVRNGDWITLSESYAKQHGNHALNGEYRIMKEVVPADNLYWDGNDINEWGYDDKSDYVYRNTKNNRKLNELVVRDDKGEIIPLSKRFNSRKKDVRFSLVGTKGAAALDKAEEASVRLDNLAVAREMEATGKDAKTVKMATGWERGADGKWRYEVQDFDVDVHGMARRNHLHDKLPWGKEYEAMVDKLFSDEMLTAEEEVRFDELSSLAQNLQETYEKTETRYLDDYVMDRSLFKAYPELRQVRVEMYNDPWSLVGATWYGSADLVRINEAKFDTQDLRSILIHEVQHAIQDIEGFARGGNESTYRNLLAGLREKHDSWAVIEEFEDKSKELGSDVQPIDVYYAVIDEYQSLGIEFGDGFAPSREAFDNGFNLWLRGYDNEGYEDAYNEYQRLVGKFGFGEGDSRYNQLAGEVEARNVQKRMDMTAEERRNSLASETEDVAREDQIFIMEHAGSSEMGSRVNRHMAEIGKRFDKEDLDSNQRAVVDVYSGKKNNETVTVKRADGNRKIVMRQGTENKAGTKHSLYRHYGRSEGEITVDDVILIPEILRDGERISTKNGKGFVYSLEKGGIRYRVLTETVNQKEVFCDFYTNKKRKQYSRVNNHEVDTQLSAHTDNITSFSDAKIDSNSESSSSDAVNNAKGDRFSLRGSKNTVATDSYSSHARLTKRQVQKVFGGIWIADKQEFAKFASAVNNHGVEHDGEGSVYTDNYFYLYYYNIDGVPIPYVSVYLNDEKSQELVNRLQDDNVTRRLGRRMQVSYSRSSALLRDEPRKSNRDSGDYSSLRGRKGNDRIYRKLLRQGRYVYNPSLYVKTGRGYEGLPDRGGRGGLEDKGSRFSLRGTSSVVERAENGCLKNLLGEEFSGSVNGLYGVLPTVARERIREQVLREVMDFSDMERAAVRMADVSADTLGYLASENPDADWWEPVCERMRNALKNAGVTEELNDNDVRYLLWANGGKNGDAPMAQPIPSSKGNEIEGVRNSVGELEHLDPKDMIEGVRFSLRVADIDREDFESMIRHDRFREGWQDAMISVRRLQDELERASGVALQDYENAYIF